MQVPGIGTGDSGYAHDINDVKDLKKLSNLKILLSENDERLPQSLHSLRENDKQTAQTTLGQSENGGLVVKKLKVQRSQGQSE